MRQLFNALRNAFLHLCFPPCCLFCHDPLDDPDHLLCAYCEPLLELIHPSTRCATCFCELQAASHKKRICVACRMKRPAFNQVGAAFEYMGPAAELVKRLKYSNSPHLATSCAAFLAVQYVKLGMKEIDYIIPVPMPALRQWMRGFNQSQEIAHALSKLLHVPMCLALGRRHGTLRQAQLSIVERQNLEASHFFLKIDLKVIEDKRLLLIDDVWTTGSTMRCCAETLSNAYPAALYGLTVCHTTRESSLKKSRI